jgi:small nuclear ribonucleoprotein (snRNP)-like protein
VLYVFALFTGFLAWTHFVLTLAVKLNGNRRVTGVLRGFDQFMNLVLEDCVEEASEQERNNLGMVVRGRIAPPAHDSFRLPLIYTIFVAVALFFFSRCLCSNLYRGSSVFFSCFLQVVRGNSVVILEALEKL